MDTLLFECLGCYLLCFDTYLEQEIKKKTLNGVLNKSRETKDKQKSCSEEASKSSYV